MGLDQTDQSTQVNCEFPLLLASLSDQYSCRFIHITTDCVYDGKLGQYNENQIAKESNIYGLSKTLGKPSIATVIQTSIIGEEINNKKFLLEWVKSQNGGTIVGYLNHLWNGVTCLQLAKIVQLMTANNYFGRVFDIFTHLIVSVNMNWLN